MQIQLKQFEIVQAIRQYVSKQGIDLADKTVDMTFTAGRKETGVSVEITIDDLASMPDVAATPLPAIVPVQVQAAPAANETQAEEAPQAKSLFG